MDVNNGVFLGGSKATGVEFNAIVKEALEYGDVVLKVVGVVFELVGVVEYVLSFSVDDWSVELTDVTGSGCRGPILLELEYAFGSGSGKRLRVAGMGTEAGIAVGKERLR